MDQPFEDEGAETKWLRILRVSARQELEKKLGGAYAEYNWVTPPMRKLHMLSIPISPPIKFSLVKKNHFNLDPSEHILGIY